MVKSDTNFIVRKPICSRITNSKTWYLSLLSQRDKLQPNIFSKAEYQHWSINRLPIKLNCFRQVPGSRHAAVRSMSGTHTAAVALAPRRGGGAGGAAGRLYRAAVRTGVHLASGTHLRHASTRVSWVLLSSLLQNVSDSDYFVLIVYRHVSLHRKTTKNIATKICYCWDSNIVTTVLWGLAYNILTFVI